MRPITGVKWSLRTEVRMGTYDDSAHDLSDRPAVSRGSYWTLAPLLSMR